MSLNIIFTSAGIRQRDNMQFNIDGYLPSGLHDHDEGSIKLHLVDSFPASSTRPAIWSGYLQHSEELRSVGVEVTEFINGSFSTTKNDPSDIDLVGFADADTVNKLTPAEQAKFEELFKGKATKAKYMCDAYFLATVPPGHPHEQQVRTMRKYWMGEFGFDRQDRPKGIIRTVVK